MGADQRLAGSDVKALIRLLTIAALGCAALLSAAPLSAALRLVALLAILARILLRLFILRGEIKGERRLGNGLAVPYGNDGDGIRSGGKTIVTFLFDNGIPLLSVTLTTNLSGPP